MMQAAVPFIRIDPIANKHICDKFEITAQTNLGVDDDVLVQVYSSSFKPQNSPSGATDRIKVTNKGENGMNTISFDVDTCTFKPDEYIVTATRVLYPTTSGSALFTVLGGIAPPAVPTTVKTNTIPTTVARIPATPSISVPIWDRNNLIYLVLLVFVFLFGAILYDTYYKKKENKK